MDKIFRKLTFQRSPQNRPDANKKNAEKLAKSLHRALEAYTMDKCQEKLADVKMMVNEAWKTIFEKEIAPDKKYEFAEELILRPEITRILILMMRPAQLESKRKIRDIFFFIIMWSSNDATDCVPRRSRSRARYNAKVRDLLYYCRDEVIEMLVDGFDDTASLGIYNEVLEAFFNDDLCIMTFLEDVGRDRNGIVVRPNGAIWEVFARLNLPDQRFTYSDSLDSMKGGFDTLELMVTTNHVETQRFLEVYQTKFLCEMNKLAQSANFYVQMRTLKLLYELLTNMHHSSTMDKWLSEPSNLRMIVICMQSNKAQVKIASIPLFELFLFYPKNCTKVHDFIKTNRDILIKYFTDTATVFCHNPIYEKEDIRYAKIIHKLFQWDLQPPLNAEQLIEFEKDAEFQRMIFEEQTVAGDFRRDMNKRCHYFSGTFPHKMIPLRPTTTRFFHQYQGRHLHK